MIRLLISCVMSGALAVVCFGQVHAKEHKLPKNPKAQAIVFDSKGGQIQRKSNEPMLQILADGTIQSGAPWGMRKRLQGKLTKKNLQQLLTFILDKQQFRKIDAKDLRLPGGLVVADASTTIIKVNADGKPHMIRAYALGLGQNPQKGSPLARAVAIRERLQSLQAVLHAGGDKGVAKHLKLANAKLKAKYPNVPALAAKDLKYAWSYANGTFSASFMRNESLGKSRRYTSVSIFYPMGMPPRVRATVQDFKNN